MKQKGYSYSYIQNQLETRFNRESRNCAELLLLTPTIAVTDKFNPEQKFLTWECHLPSLIQLENDLLRWKAFWQRQRIPDNLLEFLNAITKADFPNVFTLLCIACVLPISSCEPERSFSTLRRTKTYLRSTMLTSRLTALTVMNQQIGMDLNYDRIMEIFITKHVECLTLLYCLIIKMIWYIMYT